jgi:hypothetical protein
LPRIARAAAMVIDVVCGPIAYKTQILAYHLRRKPIVDFAMEQKRVTWMMPTKNVQYSV